MYDAYFFHKKRTRSCCMKKGSLCLLIEKLEKIINSFTFFSHFFRTFFHKKKLSANASDALSAMCSELWHGEKISERCAKVLMSYSLSVMTILPFFSSNSFTICFF